MVVMQVVLRALVAALVRLATVMAPEVGLEPSPALIALLTGV